MIRISRDEGSRAIVVAAIMICSLIAVTGLGAVPAAADGDVADAQMSDLVFDDDEAEHAFAAEIEGYDFSGSETTIQIDNESAPDGWDDAFGVGTDLEVTIVGPDAENVTDVSTTVVGEGDEYGEITLEVEGELDEFTVHAAFVGLDTTDDGSSLSPGEHEEFYKLEGDEIDGDQVLDRLFYAVHTENAAQLDDAEHTDVVSYFDGKQLTVTNDSTTANDTELGESFAANWAEDELLDLRVVDEDDEIGDLQRRVRVRNSESDDLFARFGTGTLDTGEEYVLLADDNASDGDPIEDVEDSIRFVLDPQDIVADWEQDAASETDDAVELAIDSTFRGTDFNVQIGADGLDYDDLEDLFGHLPEAQVNDVPLTQRQGDQPRFDQRADDDEITLQADDELIADFENADLDPGEYEFELEVTDAEGSATATIVFGEDRIEFDQDLYTRAAGDLVEITVDMQFTDEAWLLLGGEDAGFADVLYVEDDIGNDQVTIVANTRLIGADHSAIDGIEAEDSEVVYYAGGDTVESYVHDIAVPDDDLGPNVEEARFYDDEDLETELADFEEYLQELDLIGPGEDATDQINRPLEPSDYALVADRERNFVAEGNGVDDAVGSTAIDLVQPSVRGVTTWIGPEGDADDETTVDGLLDGLTERNDAAIGGRAVVQFETTGLVGAMAAIDYAENGNDIDDGLEDGFDTNVLHELAAADDDWAGEGIDFTFEQLEATTNQVPSELDLANAADGDAYVLVEQQESEGDDGGLYVAIDTSGDPFTRDLRDGTHFATELTYEGDEEDRFRFDGGALGGADDDTTAAAYPYFDVGVTRTAEATFEFGDPAVTFDNQEDDVVQIAPEDGSIVGGETNLAPGTEATVAVRITPPQDLLPDEDPSFLATQTVEVETDGTFDAELDLGDRVVGEEAFVQFGIGEEEPIAVVPAEFSDVAEAQAPFFDVTIDAPDTVDSGEAFEVTATTTNVGDEDGTAELSITADGDTVVRGVFDLDSGASEALTEELTAEGEDIEIVAATQDETATATVEVGGDEDDTETDDEAPEAPAEDEDDEGPPDDPTDDDGLPGFGIGVALLGVVGAALIALRRQTGHRLQRSGDDTEEDQP